MEKADIEFDVLIERIATQCYVRSAHLMEESNTARDRGNFDLSRQFREQCFELDRFRTDIRKMKNQFVTMTERDLVLEMYHIAMILDARFGKSVYKEMAATLYGLGERASNLMPTTVNVIPKEVH